MIKRIITKYKNLNLDIKDLGEINYFVGKNGSGKTRLFDAVSSVFININKSKFECHASLFNINNKNLVDTETYCYNSQLELDSLLVKNIKKNNIQDTNNPYNETRRLQGLYKEFESHLITKHIIELFFGENNIEMKMGDSDEFIGNNHIVFYENGKKLFSIDECSSGFQSLFKTWNSLLYKKSEKLDKDKSIFYLFSFDEGDRHLHPSLTKLLPEKLELIRIGIKNHFVDLGFNPKKVFVQIFVSTHSPFLIRGALQQDNHKIFHLENGKLKNSFDKQQLIEQSGLPFDNILSDLGFEMKDIYYPNCLIYVEGPTDIIYIHYWLKLYFIENLSINEKKHKDYQKGIDFDFVEYGGTLASHLTATKHNPDDQFDTNLTTSLQNMFSSNRNVLFITDDDDGKSNFENAKNRIEKILQENKKKGFNNDFIKCSSVKTIEEFIVEDLDIATKSKSKLDRSIDNVNSWNNRKDLMLKDFHPKLEQELICKVYDFIKSCQNS